APVAGGRGDSGIDHPTRKGPKRRRIGRRAAGLALALSCSLLAGHLSFAENPPAQKNSSSRSSDYDYDAPAPGRYTLPVVKPAADGDVLDSKGQPWRLRGLTRGRVTVMSFIYTRCAAVKACPYATGVLMELHRLSSQDSALAKELRLVSLSFDPRT